MTHDRAANGERDRDESYHQPVFDKAPGEPRHQQSSQSKRVDRSANGPHDFSCPYSKRGVISL